MKKRLDRKLVLNRMRLLTHFGGFQKEGAEKAPLMSI
jgi:hypothetical protein